MHLSKTFISLLTEFLMRKSTKWRKVQIMTERRVILNKKLWLVDTLDLTEEVFRKNNN